MSLVRIVTFVAVFAIQHVKSLPTNLQRKDVDRMLKENAEDVDFPDKRPLHQSAEKELEAAKRSNIEYNLNKLHDLAKLGQKRIDEDGKETKDREFGDLQRESKIYPSGHRKKEGKQLDKISESRKNTFLEHPNVEESHDYYELIHDKEEEPQGSPDQELEDLSELEGEQVGKQPNVDTKDDSFNNYEIKDISVVKEDRNEENPPIKKKSRVEKHYKRYDEILRKLHPPEEDEEEEREIKPSAESEIKKKECSSLEQKRTKENIADGKDDLREVHSLVGRTHSGEKLHPLMNHAKKEHQDHSQLHHDRLRKEVVGEKGREKNTNANKKKLGLHSLSSFNLKYDYNGDFHTLDERLGEHLVARSLNEYNQNKRESVNENRSPMEKRSHDNYYTAHENQVGNTRDAAKKIQEQYLSSLKNEDITTKDEHEIGEENRREENGSGNLTTLNEGNDHKDHSFNHEGLQDSYSFSEENELNLHNEDKDNELLKKEEEHDDDDYVIPKLQEEQDDESTIKRDNVTPSQVEIDEPNTLFHEGKDGNENEYLKKKRLIEQLESLSLMARNADVPREALDIEYSGVEDTNDGTNIQRISPPIQSKKSLKGLENVSMVQRNDIKTFTEAMKSIDDDDVSEMHAFQDEERSDLNQLDEIQNDLKWKRTKSICRTCCAVQRCWMVQGLHCNC